MQRDVDALLEPFDILIVGAGIHGAAVARLTALAGLKVALIDRDDFCSATSRNSAKLVHGGLRYIQHLDLARVRESAVAQREWRIAAPHLVRPLRFVIPTYGSGSRGPAALAAGIAVYEMATADRNRGVRPSMKLPHARVLGRRHFVGQFPMLAQPDVSGGAQWHDAQILDAPRLTFACIEDARLAGAVVANHVEALQLLVVARTVSGAVVRDRLTGREFEIRARLTIDATGPWSGRLVKMAGVPPRAPAASGLARHVNLVTRRVVADEVAIGVGSAHASSAVVGASRRLLFISPWQDCSIVGTWDDPFDGDPDQLGVTPADIAGWLAEINEALPSASLCLEDVRSLHVGLIPATGGSAGRFQRDRLIDHAVSHDLDGLISVAGVKLTTAPTAARRTLGLACRRLGIDFDRRNARFSQPLPGAPESDAPTVAADGPNSAGGLDPRMQATAWVRRVYGSRSTSLLDTLPANDLPVAEHIFRCRVVYGLHHEMVVTLGDAIFRATDHAERGVLTDAQLGWTARTLGDALAWNSSRRTTELGTARTRLAALRPFISAHRPAGTPID
jgi:glycerol-3-phosphate dehydrogenase